MAVQNSLQRSNGGNKPATFSSFLAGDAIKRKINNIVGGKDGQRFITAITSAVSTNPMLAECENSTILSAALLGESLKLSPSPQLGQYYLVPFNDKKRGCKVAQFQLGYKGYVQLAIRSGMYKKLNVLPLKSGELINFDPLEETIEVQLIDDEVARENAPTIGYYAMFEYTNGFKKAMYWSREKMVSHAGKFSQAFSIEETEIKTKYGMKKKVSYDDFVAGKYDEKDEWMYSSFWYKDFDGMACKTMLRQLISKWGIMSIEMQQAFESDQGVINDSGHVDYVENQPSADYEATATVVENEPDPMDAPIAPALSPEDDPFLKQ